MKMWVVFSISPRLRHIGHLDLMRSMQRALRRSNLPISYSHGFNPHILLSLAAPLSVGMSGENEVMEVPLSAPIAEEDFQTQLQSALPQGIRVSQCLLKQDDVPAPMAALSAAQYVFSFSDDAQALLDKVPEFLAREEVPAVRKGKKGEVRFNLRPLVYNLLVKDGVLHAALALSEKGTAKPDILVKALSEMAGVPAPHYIATRTRLLDSAFAPLENR